MQNRTVRVIAYVFGTMAGIAMPASAITLFCIVAAPRERGADDVRCQTNRITARGFGAKDNAPAWLKPQFDQLQAMFGMSALGAGRLSIGDGGTGKDCNNQQIVGVPGTEGNVYQYSQLDAALNEFQVAYAKARAAGQAAALSWSSANGAPPPSAGYESTSYQSETQYYALARAHCVQRHDIRGAMVCHGIRRKRGLHLAPVGCAIPCWENQFSGPQ